MRVSEAIEIVDRLKPNAFDARDKMRWLSELDHSVYEEVIRTKEDVPMKPILDVSEKPVEPVEPEEGEEVSADEVIEPEEPAELEEVGFTAYVYGESEDKELLIPSPYTECYIAYLAAKVDFYNNDSVGYQNEMIMFNALYDQFAAWYTRRHKPKQENRIQV